ncbi:MAG: DUF3641 domain-containing protein, partial [Chlorobiaceae bacterium]|nr:DUF3641 domain-containing protein [Chlorobiaceae bacterium]
MQMQTSLHKRQNPLADATEQVRMLEKTDCGIPAFSKKLAECGCSPLTAEAASILQVNTGYRCNLLCRHCHVDGGPDRKETMERETLQQCLDALRKGRFGTLDITGGAPEMNSALPWFIREARKIMPEGEILVRTNLVILLSGEQYGKFPELYKENRVTIIASLPCHTRQQVDAQRGEGVFDRSIEALKLLNSIGYGAEESGLLLNLMYNPGGPSLPGQQQAIEADFKKQLLDKYGIFFSSLFTITNMPVSRFLESLVEEGQFCKYMK